MWNIQYDNISCWLGVVVLIMHISECIIIITSLPSVQSPDRPVGDHHRPHARQLQTLAWIIRTVMAHIYLEINQPQPSPGRPDLTLHQSEPHLTRCPGWFHLNFLFSIKFSTCPNSLNLLFCFFSLVHLNISASQIRFVLTLIWSGPVWLADSRLKSSQTGTASDFLLFCF